MLKLYNDLLSFKYIYFLFKYTETMICWNLNMDYSRDKTILFNEIRQSKAP